MKKLLLLIATLAMALSLAACGTNKDEEKPGDKTGNKTEDQTGDQSEDKTGDQSDDQSGDQTDDQTGDQTGDQTDDQTGNQGTGNLEGSLEEIMDKIYETANVDANFKEYIKTGLMKEEVTAERAEYHLGKADIEFEEALASEPMMQPGAYSLVLVRVKEGADVEKIKTDIKENVDPMKWVCVGVQEENVIVDSIGDIIFLVMSDDQAKPLHEAFLALK